MNPQLRQILMMLGRIPGPGHEGAEAASMLAMQHAQQAHPQQMQPRGAQVGQQIPYEQAQQMQQHPQFGIQVGQPQIQPQQPQFGVQVGKPTIENPPQQISQGKPKVTIGTPTQQSGSMTVPGITVTIPHHAAPEVLAAIMDRKKKKNGG